jgi:hypothetical protein
VFGAIWRWSRPTAGRRVAGAILSAAIVAGVALLWAPELPLPGAPSGPLYAATAPFVPIQPNEQFTLTEIAVSQGSLGAPGVTAGRAAPAQSAAPAAGEGGASPQPAASAAPSASTAPSASPTQQGSSAAPTPAAQSSTPCPRPSGSATPSAAASPPSAGACP